MIKFYFFPFTFMNARQARVLSCFFNQLHVLDIHGNAVLPEPLAALEASGAVARVCPDREKLSLAEQQVRAYLSWAAIHKGNEKNLRALIREDLFFRNDSSVAAIRADIRNRMTAHDDPAGAPVARNSESDRETCSDDALVFLKLADIYDRESQEIQAALDALDQENAALFSELKGEAGEALSGGAGHAPEPESEPGWAMTERRIDAWLSAAGDAGCLDPGQIPVLVTTSRAVMDQFLADAGKAINGLDIDSIKVHENSREIAAQHQLDMEQRIMQMARGLTPDSDGAYVEGSGTGQIQIRLFQGDGGVHVTPKNPGRQIGICLVALNA